MRVDKARLKAAWLLWALLMAFPCLGAAAGELSLAPASMARIGTVDERFQSYNIEMVEVTGGRFWKPYPSARFDPHSDHFE